MYGFKFGDMIYTSTTSSITSTFTVDTVIINLTKGSAFIMGKEKLSAVAGSSTVNINIISTQILEIYSQGITFDDILLNS